jgi:GNAT superfamily N-acetyltransferase
MILIRSSTFLDSLNITAMWMKMHLEITKREALLKENSNVKNLFNQVVTRLDDPNWIILIAEEEGKIAGFTMGKVHWPLYSQCHIVGTCETLYVYPEYRGKRVHKLLIDKLREIGTEKGAIEFEFYCMNDKRVLDLYDKLGYEPVQVVLRQKEK